MKKAEIKKLDKIWSAMVKEDTGGRCTICGRVSGDIQLHPHHYIGRRIRATRWYLPNGIALCASHHTMGLQSAHENPEWFRKQMLDIRGELWLKDITQQSNKIFKGTFEQVKKYLDGETENYL